VLERAVRRSFEIFVASAGKSGVMLELAPGNLRIEERRKRY
jgi:hypothetical protein